VTATKSHPPDRRPVVVTPPPILTPWARRRLERQEVADVRRLLEAITAERGLDRA
jgi:hypothetical protein